MHRLAWILVLTSACVASGGDESFNIVNNVAPGAGCAITAGSSFVARGVIDKASPNPYLFTPEIVSRITAAEGTEAQRTIVLRGAHVEVFNASGSTRTSIGKFDSLFAASIPPGGSTTAAFDIVTADMVRNAGASGTTRVQLVAKITPFGAIGGSGDNVSGVSYEYPVTVCDGCVAQNLGTCPLPMGTTLTTDTMNSCNPYQDGTAPCCMGATGLVCPATISTTAPVMLTIAKTGTNAATATVTSSPAGITCGTTCTSTFATGASVMLSVTGAANVTWTGATGCTTGTTCTVTMDAAKNVSVALEP